MATIPSHLHRTLGTTPEGAAWIDGLPSLIEALTARLALSVGEPVESEASCAWVTPATTADGRDVMLKLGYPHMEAMHEIDGLAFWHGDPTVLLVDADREAHAMVLERCRPGRHLRTLPERDQDEILAGLLRRLWRPPPPSRPFRPLARMIDSWCTEIREREEGWSDEARIREGLAAFEELAGSQREHVVLATDLHAGNVLSAERQPWLVIDPKPFVGDPCYDATQHLLNCRERMSEAPRELVARLAGLLGIDEVRLRGWAFARFALLDADDVASTARIAARLADGPPITQSHG